MPMCELTLTQLFEAMNNTPAIVRGFEWFGSVEKNELDRDFPQYDVIVAADVVCNHVTSSRCKALHMCIMLIVQT